MTKEKPAVVTSRTRQGLRQVETVANLVLGEASAESVFRNRVKKLNEKSRQMVIPSGTNYRELPMFGYKVSGNERVNLFGLGKELEIFFRHLVPGLASVVLKRSYWIQGPLENAPIFVFWAAGDALGLSRAGLTAGHGGYGKEAFFKAVTAAIPGLPTTPMHAVIDKYLAERYITYTSCAVKAWHKTIEPLGRTDYRENYGRDKSASA